MQTPERPDWLTGEAVDAWEYLAPKLQAIGILALVDRMSLERYCRLYQRWRQAERDIEQFGAQYFIKDDHGNPTYPVTFPHTTLAGRLSTQLKGLEREFGMTPSARSSINADTATTRTGDGDLGKYLRTKRA